MPYIAYEPGRSFTPASSERIEQANRIIDEYRRQGLDLTLRQLYYQFVARGLLRNTQREYSNLGALINNARLAGLVDWSAIIDRTRSPKQNSHWRDPAQILRACRDQYQIEKWASQHFRVEVWIEKEALSGVLQSCCPDLDVTYFACRGYVSSSAIWRAAQRVLEYLDQEQEVVILHLGDHDPSGIDMTDDIWRRMVQLINHHRGTSEGFTVERVALTMEQVREFNPPPNPAKLTDSRVEGYTAQYGYESWELDALDPRVLVRMIRERALYYRDDDRWDMAIREEEAHKGALQDMLEAWESEHK